MIVGRRGNLRKRLSKKKRNINAHAYILVGGYMNKKQEKIDISKLNEVLGLSKKILRMTFLFLVVIGIYAITLILKEWKILAFILTFLKILLPLFIGLIIAWLLEPVVKYLHKKGLNRVLGAILVYIVMLSALYFTLTSFFPMFLHQVNDFLKILPSILDSISIWLNRFLENFRDISIIDIEMVKADTIQYVNSLISSLTTDIPEMAIEFIKSLFSTVGVFAIGLIIGFYLLVSFDNVGKTFLSILPPRIRNNALELFADANTSLFAFLKGTILIAFIVFAFSTIALTLIGTEAPLLLGFICGITNIIPYIGPYIGGAIAATVGFSQSISIGLLTVIVIVILQMLESIILQPLVMSRTMKLHPVTVLIGLLIFGYFFGIVGLIISTPLVAMLKSIAIFFDKKYHIFRK